jgi:hypothetical protein
MHRMIPPAPTTEISPALARGTFAGEVAPTATKPGYIKVTFTNNYELHLIPDGPVTAQLGKRLVGEIRSQARRIDESQTGGRFVEPLSGRPRRIQGSIIAVDARGMGIGMPSAGFTNFTNGFSAGVWAYTSAVGNYARYFDFGNPGGGGDSIDLTREGTTNNLRLEVWKNGGVTGLNAPGAIKLNTWQHFSVTVTSAGVATLFVNGNPVATGTSQGFIPSVVNRPSCYLGKSNNPVDALFQGQMSNFSFWKTALTPAQVQAASNSTLSGSEANLAYYDSLGFIPQSVTPNITTPAALPYSTTTAQVFIGMTIRVVLAAAPVIP